MTIYCAWAENDRNYEDYTEVLVGVYSTREKAELAAARWVSEQNGEDEDTVWRVQGVFTLELDDLPEGEGE